MSMQQAYFLALAADAAAADDWTGYDEAMRAAGLYYDCEGADQ